jgi:glutamyl-tRNA synthetase
MDNNLQEKVVTRFAPSPTGFMHVGGVRTAIFAYLFAKKHNGTFILRIEDTDKAREVSGSVDHIIESLKWFGLDYDYGPDKVNPFGSAKQSERLESYLKWARILEEKGLAYQDPFTDEEIESLKKKAEEEKRPFLIREHRKNVDTKWDGKSALRFKVPVVKRYTWTDEVRGELSAGEEALDDFILIKADGYPTYNFAHIIDDFEMGVSHIIRGQEFISSTPKFLSLYDALGFKYPKFITVPPILRDDRTKKLGKRDGAKDILDYKKEGYLPEALFNFLAFLGWHPVDERELFTKEDLINIFDIHRIQKGGALFDEKKLDWINREHIRKLKNSQKVSFISDFIPEKIKSLPYFSEEMVLKSAHTIVDHIEKGLDVSTMEPYLTF